MMMQLLFTLILTRLNAAIPNLTNSGFGASDPIYAGNLLGEVW
jgi:hypothetical protein